MSPDNSRKGKPPSRFAEREYFMQKAMQPAPRHGFDIYML